MNRRPALATALAGAAALTLAGCNVSLQSLPKYSSMAGPFYTVHATFANVLNLPVDAQVRSGVATIGQVSSIEASNYAADVTLQIKKDVRLPAGTRAEVQFDDPLGNEYVEMLPPSKPTSGYLANEATLTLADTGSAPSVADTLAALSTVLNGGGINQLQTIITQMNLTFDGNQPEIRDLIAKVEESFGSLAAHTPDIDAALAALGAMAKALNAGTPEIVAGINALAPAANILSQENGELRQLLTSVNQLTSVADKVADKTSQDSINDIDELLPVVDQLVGVDRQIGPALAAISRFEALTPKIAPGDSLQVSLNATADFGSSATADLRGLEAAAEADDLSGWESAPPPSSGAASLLEAALP